MQNKTKGVVIALTAATLFTTNCLAATTTNGAQVASGSVQCQITANDCRSPSGCPTKTIIKTKTAKECMDKGGKVQ
jgi:hypothetical protein